MNNMSQKACMLKYIDIKMVMGDWLVGQWIVGVKSFQKVFGLCGLKGHIVEKMYDVTLEDGQWNVKTSSCCYWKLALRRQDSRHLDCSALMSYFLGLA